VLKLLLEHDRRGGVRATTASRDDAEKLAAERYPPSPECAALVRAVMDGKTVAEFEAQRKQQLGGS